MKHEKYLKCTNAPRQKMFHVGGVYRIKNENSFFFCIIDDLGYERFIPKNKMNFVVLHEGKLSVGTARYAKFEKIM